MFKSEKTWRSLSYFWSFATMAFIVIDFLSLHSYEFLFAPLGGIYLGVLGIYAGTKEFNRWHDMYDQQRHPGEWFVVSWTIVIFSLITISALFKNKGYGISPESVAVYLSVLTIFALTQRSKYLYKAKKK